MALAVENPVKGMKILGTLSRPKVPREREGVNPPDGNLRYKRKTSCGGEVQSSYGNFPIDFTK